MPTWVQIAYSEYEKRLPPEWKPKCVELAVAKRGKNANIGKLIDAEGDQIMATLPTAANVIALDVSGRAFSTEVLAEHMAQWQQDPRPLYFLIGGPDGLASRCLARADMRWSLSELTMPHPLVRIVLIEQLYRGWTILNNHPYHK